MKRFVTSLLQSSDLNTSVFIGISYYSLTRQNSPKYLEKLYVRLGPLVLSIALSQRENLLTMLRHTLIQLAIYPLFIKIIRFSVLGVRIPNFLVRLILRLAVRTFTTLSIRTLMIYSLKSLVIIKHSVRGGRLSLTSSPDAVAFLTSLLEKHYRLIQFTEDSRQFSV